MKDDVKDLLNMTADSVGRDLLGALVTEIKLLPDVWQKLSEAKQNSVIDRLRNRVETNVRMAVHCIASEGRTVVTGDMEQITIKDGVKAVIKFGPHTGNLHELYESSGKPVLVVVANAADHTGGMDEIQGENDQRAMDLGGEYADDDGGGMDDDVVDAEVKTLEIEHQHLESELTDAYNAGHEAASEGRPQSDCPIMAGALCIEWVKGWKAWHAEQAQP